MQIIVTKHHGLGNDFLVFETNQIPVDALNSGQISWSKVAQKWCNRELSAGADGLLLLTRSGEYLLGMQLYNQDGSRAELSGNGIRCLVQAAFQADQLIEPVSYMVNTDVGERRVDVRPISNNEISATVEMGEIIQIDAPTNWNSVGADPNRPVIHLSIGNPHTVVGVEDVNAVNLLEIGQKVPQVNLEIIEPGPEPHAITMRVHERGAGITKACGTGACASAWAAKHWGLVASSVDQVLVHQPGGDALVGINVPSSGHVTLTATAHYVDRYFLELPL